MRIEARAVSYRYAGAADPAVAGLDLTLTPGELVAVVGPNGAGKSTLLALLSGWLEPSDGGVLLDGRPLGRLAARERGRSLAYLPQRVAPLYDLTVEDMVLGGRYPHRAAVAGVSPADRAAVSAALDATHTSDLAHRPFSELSGGERQRVLLARALATESRVLLLDEPTTHLDAPHQVALGRLARRLAPTHAIVSVLHDLPLALAADRVLVMVGGRVTAYGDAADPSLHAALVTAFDGAVQVRTIDGRAQVLPVLDGVDSGGSGP